MQKTIDTLTLFRSAMIVATLATMAALSVSRVDAQVRQPLRVKLSVSPTINVTRLDAGLQNSFSEEVARLDQLSAGKTGGGEILMTGPGFSIAAYENISVLVTVTPPLVKARAAGGTDDLRITCGYLNDGTTYFRRSVITNKSVVEFRLRNSNLLKRSMKLGNPVFVAYVFFLIHERKEANTHGAPLQVPTVTVEFL